MQDSWRMKQSSTFTHIIQVSEYQEAPVLNREPYFKKGLDIGLQFYYIIYENRLFILIPYIYINIVWIVNMKNKPDSIKYRQLVDTAQHFFFQFGTKRVSIEEICKTAGVSKMTFYKYFRNKTDLITCLFQELTDLALKSYQQIMESDLPFETKVEQIIQYKKEQASHISQAFYHDLYQNPDPEIMSLVREKAAKNLQIVINDLREAQKKGHLRSDIKVEFIHYFLNHMLEMASDERLIQLYTSPQELTEELTQFFFYGILKR
jgi:AcrR family transcriptional regulator